MARKSRKTVAASVSVSGGKIYKTAVYVRLSREDERKIESDTVENQKAFLLDFVSKDASLEIKEVYVDRHVTGTKFDRPEFNRMIADMRAGKIDCIVVKDLSRLGRNYLEAGDYIEKIFPFFGVRFIAVTDNYDSLNSSAAEDGLIVPLKNLINEAYAKDISKKISTSYMSKFEKGIYMATTAAYGYKKDPDDSHNLLVDENVRDVVIRIFRERAAGKSNNAIARDLNADGIPAPSVYWQTVDVIHKEKYTNFWEGKQVKRILQNVVYIGDVEISKTYQAYYKGITKAVTRDKEDRYYVRDHHEPIIDRETFDRVQELVNKTTAEYHETQRDLGDDRNRREDKLQGILYCGHCGMKMTLYRKTVKLVNSYGHYSTYYCRRSATYIDTDPHKNIKADDLEALVLELLKQHIAVYVDAKERMRMLNRKGETIKTKLALEKELDDKENRRKKIGDFIKSLYADFSDGIFSEKEYLEMKAEYIAELETLDAETTEIREKIEECSPDYAGDKAMAEAFEKYLGVTELTKEMVQTFIRKITCYGKDRFEVEYTFADELAEYIEKGADAA